MKAGNGIKRLVAVGLLVLAANVVWASPAEDAARGVIARAVGKAPSADIKIEIVSSEGKLPFYIYSATDGIVTLKGSSPVAVCRGFYDYLRANGLGMVGWRGAVVRLPPKWPDAPETRCDSPFKFKQMYNVVTAGYSFPYWNRERWSRELDWLALHGYNMIMAPIGTEAIMQRVWLKTGLTQAEIDAYNCGPAHMPWQRMGNICHTDGPLPQSWMKDQIALQHFILQRMRALGMQPIVQSFAGFVPHAMKRLYPDEKYYVSHWNSGFRGERAPIYVLPESKLFQKIFKEYITEWQKEFGDGRYYLVDTFDEIKGLPSKPGKTTEEVMADYGADLVRLLRDADEDSVWVIQGWIFGYQRNIWKQSIVKALFSRVPDERLLILDMIAQWNRFGGYYGKPWIYGIITNMGGKTPWYGKLDSYVNGVATMLKSPGRNNNVGMSNHSEGIEVSEIIFELLADLGWANSKINLDEWLEQYCRNRYGKCPPEMLQVFQAFRHTAFHNKAWNARFGWQRGNGSRAIKLYSGKFIQAVQEFLAMRDQFRDSPFYQDDAVELASFVLGQYAEINRVKSLNALKSGDQQAYRKCRGLMEKELLQADRLLESHALNRLERWQGFAAGHPGSREEREFYQENARRIITSWGPPVNDYSARIWSGLIRDFYLPRLMAAFDAQEHKKRFDKNAWEDRWIRSLKISEVEPYSDPLDKAAEFVDAAIEAGKTKYKAQLNGNVLASWNPGQMSTEWTTVDWTLDPALLKRLKGVKFVFTKGHHRIRIQSVEVVADGNVAALDRHEGLAGYQMVDNVYKLDLPAVVTANNECLLRVTLRSEGGTDSAGNIEIIEK